MAELNLKNTLDDFKKLISSAEGFASALKSVGTVQEQLQKSATGFDWF